MYFIDTHTHLNMLEGGVDEALKLARANNVKQFINIGTCADDHKMVLETAQKHYPFVFCTLGVHPHDAKDFEKAKSFLIENLHHKEVVAVGEIGLDYFYKNSSEEEQRKAFREQIELSIENKLPIEIHTRDAEEDTISILNEYKGEVKGLIHCFTGTQWLADEALKLGFNFSISGVVTFKNANDLREVVKSIPLDRLHTETDAPFLSPVPMRGKKNQPAFVIHTAEKIAELKQVSVEELIKQVQINTKNLFPKIQLLEEEL